MDRGAMRAGTVVASGNCSGMAKLARPEFYTLSNAFASGLARCLSLAPRPSNRQSHPQPAAFAVGHLRNRSLCLAGATGLVEPATSRNRQAPESQPYVDGPRMDITSTWPKTPAGLHKGPYPPS
jgi:hypothetical protein